MEWLEERYRKYQKSLEHRTLIGLNAMAVFNELIRDLGNVVKEANKMDMRLIMNGNPTRRTISMTIYPPRGAYPATASPRVMSVELAEDKRSITATFDSKTVAFRIAVNGEDTVCLMREESEIVSQHAARSLME